MTVDNVNNLNTAPGSMRTELPPSELVAQICDRAAQILEEDGWCQHTEHDDSGAHCAYGAIDSALERYPEVLSPSVAGWIRMKIASQAKRKLTSNMINWNDTPGREAHEVIDLFKGLAKDLRNEATP